jgi:4-hydroxy-tetrahydrodipicolinate synthase
VRDGTLARLRGSIPPLVTPFRDGAVDRDAFARLVEHVLERGSHGVLANGTTAEPTTLSIEERNELVSLAVDVAHRRRVVVAATGGQNFEETVALTRHAERSGVDALLIVTPYFSRPPQRGLVEYYVRVCAETSLPVLLYHIPGRASVSVEVDTLERIREKAPNFVGMKHAAQDVGFVAQAIASLGDDFRIFAGLEELSLPMLSVGAIGMMNAVANVDPGRVAALYEAVVASDLGLARKLNRELAELNAAIFFETNPIPIKYLLRRMGLLHTNEHRLPMVPASPELCSRLDKVLERAGLI